MNALNIAIERAQGVCRLADAIGVGQSVISNWRKRGTLPDPVSCVRIERKFGVTRQELRPFDWSDIWPELVSSSQESGHD